MNKIVNGKNIALGQAEIDIILEERELNRLEVENNMYITRRKYNYPSIAQQLDLLYHDKVNNTDVWYDTVKAVKDAYPKPKEYPSG